MARPAKGTPALPISAEKRYVSDLRRVWRVAQQTIIIGLQPLLRVWPADPMRTDADYPTGWQPPPMPQRSVYPAGRRSYQRSPSPMGIFGPPPLTRRIWELTDDDLIQLWPNLNPDDVREFAPWATSRMQVIRIAYPAGETRAFDIEGKVRAAIEKEKRSRLSRRALNPVEIEKNTRAADAFRPRYVPAELRPVIFASSGAVMIPPQPLGVNAAAIEIQMNWIRIVLEDTLGPERLSPVLDRAAQGVDRVAQRELQRLIPIDVRQAQGAQASINAWREANVNLIGSGIMAPLEPVQLRPSMLGDVSRIIEQAHRAGLRVEALAGELLDRFGVSESRAELIARDQVLKLNSQIHKDKQQSLGVTQYIWKTAGDKRVRERHAELNGSLQSWDNPPEVAPGRHEHPGGDFQCRCRAKPVIPLPTPA